MHREASLVPSMAPRQLWVAVIALQPYGVSIASQLKLAN
jgi:hypothetical protein